MSQLKSKPPSKRKRKNDKPNFRTNEDNCLFDEEPPSKLFKKDKVVLANFRKENLPSVPEFECSERSSKF